MLTVGRKRHLKRFENMSSGTKALRHEGTKWCQRQKGRSEGTFSLPAFLTPSCLRACVPSCLIRLCLSVFIGGLISFSVSAAPTTQPTKFLRYVDAPDGSSRLEA